ncbi:GH116 family glycosyl hydrolase [Fimbriimonas ginsengisoli]|uniref:Twin-arginine translocation signal domain-containing protein n=1 Tax=Fimbriimonas ginsengisoli Gsoil 348 TaxID=661478 RepID=A0A068NQA8_FIMGI|nr:GH116 family glycosyl hydrolase [Fimbriimonas ginsengisoli]AIE85581.1 hypothetical protein OP10G_2213 [Fimbriimonas ginsengisoli Gsoil 348]
MADQLIPRRDFIKLTGAAVAGISLPRRPGQKTPDEFARLVPTDKKLDPKWVASLTAPGKREFYRGDELKFIGMPVGGICAGQVYLGGDGRLWLWDIFNQLKFGVVDKSVVFRGEKLSAGGGANYIEPPLQVHPFAQGFSLQAETAETKTVRPLDSSGWSDIAFSGEYPIGLVQYRDPESPVSVDLEAFSPFIPLDEDDSGLPAVVMRYTVRNLTAEPVKVRIAGWMTNPVGLHTVGLGEARYENESKKGKSHTRIDFSLKPEPLTEHIRPPIVFDDFESDTYAQWTVSGTAFGPAPYERSKLAGYQGDVGGTGRFVVNSHNVRNGESVAAGDAHTGRMVSHEFTIQRRYIEFWIGGGNHPGKTCINLHIEGDRVQSVTGHDSNQMRRAHFDVGNFEGRKATLEIVDEESGAWGNIGIDDIRFVDSVSAVPLEGRPDVGEMSLALLGNPKGHRHIHGPSADEIPYLAFANPHELGHPRQTQDGRTTSAANTGLSLAPGASETFTFLVAWRFPNLELPKLGKVGHHYAARFANVGQVVQHIANNLPGLYGKTKLWHETWYDSTVPRWLLDRTMATTSTLATMTCVRFANGRFYGWEGIGCCEGTCGHVWQYAQAMGRLFPKLERTVREMVDFGVAFHPETGIVEFRGEYGNGYAADAQAGYVLRAYREHQVSRDSAFLHRVYSRAKKALEYLISQDPDEDGILVGRQHNTLDVDLYGPSSWLSSLYLAALRAGEEMAKETGDKPFAARCRKIFLVGQKRFVPVMWNGDYFVQRADPAYPDALRYDDGCEVDQVMGQWWAWQLGLGCIIEGDRTKRALRALYRNNFLPDVGPYRDKFTPGRWYAMPGEGGLVICTFPRGDRERILGNRPTWASMYFNECMTGFEYEAAGHMISEGLVREGLAVIRTVHDRYSPSRRNPYNEVECSDHYARCMAVYGAYLAVCGFEYHGPKGHIGFAPRVTPEHFRAAFTGAEGWGTYEQRIGKSFEASFHVKHGELRLRTISFDVPMAIPTSNVRVTGKHVTATAARVGRRVTVTFSQEVVITEGETVRLGL